MKNLTMSLLLAFPMAISAQDYSNMNEADLEKMMQQMEKMQSCMGRIDETKIKSLEQRTKKMEAEVQSLCAAGDRDQAQEKAMAYGEDLANDPTMRSLVECGEIMKDAIPDISFSVLNEVSANRHICD